MNTKIFFIYFVTVLFIPQMIAQYEVGHSTFTLIDASRNDREIDGHLYYPADMAGDDVAWSNGSFPLIVFGHGFGMAWSEYSVWWEELVAQGYVLAFPTTEGSIVPFPSHGDFGEDLAFIIDAYMLENADTNSPYYQKFTAKNAVMGHSMGGGCSYLAAGTFDANATTVVTLAAANTDPSSIAAAANISIPVLTIAGSSDCVVEDGGAPIDIYNGLTNTSYKAYVEITDASHCQFGIASFGSICTLGELCGGFLDKSEQHQQMFLSAVPWLDYHLKEDCDAWATFKNHLTTSDAHSYQEAGALPMPTLATTATATTICPEETATLNATIEGAYCAFEWQKDGAMLSNDFEVDVMEGGTYTAVAENADGETVTENVVIEIAPTPEVTISETDGVLESSVTAGGQSFTYQWYLDGNPISGATSSTYDATTTGESGMYSVEVTNQLGCTTISAAIQVTLTSIVDIGNGDIFQLYPTHTNGPLVLDWQGETTKVNWYIMDSQGKLIQKGNRQLLTQQNWSMDVADLPQGLYFFTLETAKGRGTGRFIKQ